MLILKSFNQRNTVSTSFTIVKITLIHLIVGSSCNYIQKCCDLNQQLSTNFDDCIDFDGSRSIDWYEVDNNVDPTGVSVIKMGKKDRQPIWWLPPGVQFLSADASGIAFKPLSVGEVQNLRFLYNRKNPCPKFSEILLPFNDYVYLLDNGSLLVTGIADNVRPETMIFPQNIYCLDRVSLIPTYLKRQKSHVLDHSFAIFVCPSLAYTCVRMCCHKRNHLKVHDGFEKCEYAPEIPATWSLNYIDYDGKAAENSRSFGIVEGIPKCHDYYYLNDNSSTHTQSFWILPDGSVRVENRSTDVSASDYCIHFLNIRGHYQLNLRVCSEMFNQHTTVEKNETRPNRTKSKPFFKSHCLEQSSQQMHTYKVSLGKIYSVTGATFLALTLFIYIFMWKRRVSVFDKIFSWHVSSLLVCYSTMAFDKIDRPATRTWSCKLIGYVIQYTFIASTLWLNVMCLYLHHSFRDYYIIRLKRESANKLNTYLIYSIYVWGAAAIISFGTFLMDNTNILDSSYKPQFGVETCWLQNSISQLIYFYLPLAVILASNLFLFIFILKRIYEIHKKLSELNTLNSKKYFVTDEISSKSIRFSLFVRLLSLSSITWIFEIVSWYVGGPDYYLYLPDIIHSFRGVFIFIICCCKKEIVFSILKPPKSSSNQANGWLISLPFPLNTNTRNTSVSSIPMVSLRHGSEASAEESA